MPDKKTCFVVMGFGKKTDYQTGRVLDLDKSYKNIIKPAAEAAGLDCKRADEIVHSGTIDVPMYEQLLSADVVVADVSTYNPNAFYELGVRHALRPYTTITIAEDKMTFPFDIGHIAVRKYHHMGEGIDFDEVERMRAELKNAMETILSKTPEKDSPIYTFFSDLEPPMRKKLQQAIAESAPAAMAAPAPASTAATTPSPTMSMLMEQAAAAMARSDCSAAKALYTAARTLAPNDPFVAQRLALVTYKSHCEEPMRPLQEAAAILEELSPATSTDTETLGLWGAVHKRMWDVRKQKEDLDTAISAYEKGFYLKNDYYNGINLAFLYDVRASTTSGNEAIADAVMARRVRQRVLSICENFLSERSTLRPDDEYWVLATMAEAYAGIGDKYKAEQLLSKAKALNQPDWMLESTNTQLAKLNALLATGPLPVPAQ